MHDTGTRVDYENGDPLYNTDVEDLRNELSVRQILGGINTIFTMDKPGPGGANHAYGIIIAPRKFSYINFQEGPIGEAGPNGCREEDLLAIVKDRLECFQAGSFPCEENARALKKVQEAIDWLNYRTAERVKRGVEGTDNA